MVQSTNRQELSRKEREKFSRQQDILNAARQLFILKGYHKTTLAEIARHAEFGKGTIYNYFSSKEELFYGIIDQLADETFEIVRSAVSTPGDAREKLTAYAKAIISQAHNNADLFRLIIQEIHRTNFSEYKVKLEHLSARVNEGLKLIAQPIEEEIHAKKIRPFDPLKLIALFDGMLRLYCIDHYKNHLQLQDDEVDTTVAFIVSVFFDGVTDRNLKG